CRVAVEKQIVIWEGMELNVKVSIGVSTNKDTGLACKQADHALYYSKENGRNMVSQYSDKIKDWFFLRTKKEN
ncbi:MAG: hypothetical protein U9Q66_03380, partial [Patescibacteria group bacterium]|nr:hypothetical protein [Patescibacteria group bacterium]